MCIIYPVIIIGAGLAGLSASKEFTKLGVQSLILEARDRVGGRINTISFGDGVVDAGASWIHGEGPGTGDSEIYKNTMNPLYEIAVK